MNDQAKDQNLLAVWENGKLKAARASSIIKVYITYSLFTIPLGWAISFVSVFDDDSRSGTDLLLSIFFDMDAWEFSILIIVSIAYVSVLLSLYSELTYTSHVLMSRETIKELPRESKDVIQNLIKDICEQLNINVNSIHFWVNFRSYHFSPSIVEHKNKINLFLPLAFFKILNKYPREARAMLAHELAHVSQKDTKLWLFASGYVRSIEILLPVNIGIFLTSIFIIVHNYTELIVDLEYNTLGSMFLSIVYHLQALTDLSGGIIVAGVPQSIPVLLLFLFFRHVRKMRHRSEYLADLASSIFVGGEYLRRILKRYDPEINKNRDSFTVHPTVYDRIKSLKKHNALSNSDRNVEGEQSSALMIRQNTLVRNVAEHLVSIRSYVGLFERNIYGINFYFAIGFLMANILSMLNFTFLVDSPVGSIYSLRPIEFYFVNFIYDTLASTLLLFISYSISKNWLLPLVWGFVNIVIRTGARNTLNAFLSFELFLPTLPNMLIIFLDGFLFMAALILTIRYFGLRLWSLTFGITLSLLLPKIAYPFLGIGYFNAKVIKGVIITGILYGAFIYSAFYLYFKRKFQSLGDIKLGDNLNNKSELWA